MKNSPRIPLPRRSPRGVALLFGLITLAIMLIGAAAMARSMNTSLFNAGNLGFKRDLTNQAERAVTTTVALLEAGGALAAAATRENHLVARNYSATMLASNPQGLPLALLDDTAFAAVGQAANDVAVAAQGVTVRYVIDRLCTATGAPTADQCTLAGDPQPNSCSANECINAANASAGGAGAIGSRVVYRISIRVTGPRNTQSFFQTTLTI